MICLQPEVFILNGEGSSAHRDRERQRESGSEPPARAPSVISRSHRRSLCRRDGVNRMGVAHVTHLSPAWPPAPSTPGNGNKPLLGSGAPD